MHRSRLPLILADDNPAARLLSRPGEAIYNAANGLVEGNNLFQVAWLPDDKRDHYLAQVQALAQDRGYRSPQPQIVFEGNTPADVAKNCLLHDLLAASDWPAPTRRVSAWLGEPIAIKEPTAAYFHRQSGSNLLIVGQNDEAAMGMLAIALISLSAQHTPSLSQEEKRGADLSLPGEGRGGDACFYVFDFSPVDTPYANLLPRLIDLLPHSVRVGHRRELPDLIAEIAEEVNRRLEEGVTILRDKPAIYLIICGLQRAHDLRQEDDFGLSRFNSTDEAPVPPNPAQQFATILREGPDLGVHTLVWCDTLNNLNRTLDRRLLREFDLRVAFQMNAEDSANLIDTPAASK
ncbi:MAG: cell division protein FtsK, partial [Chloroflexota bacterium]